MNNFKCHTLKETGSQKKNLSDEDEISGLVLMQGTYKGNATSEQSIHPKMKKT